MWPPLSHACISSLGAVALTEDATTSSVAFSEPDPGGDPPLPVVQKEADVVIYGTTTSAIGAVRALQKVRKTYPQKLEVVVIGGGPVLESTIVQGLAVEDLYNSSGASGFYEEFRKAVLQEYARRGVTKSYESRLTVEPEMAELVLRWYLDRNGAGREGITFVQGKLVAAGDADDRYVVVRTAQEELRVDTRYFIDASPEADLARMLGADYRMGRSEEVYNDATGDRAPRPNASNDWATSPQSMSILLTLRIHPRTAPSVESLGIPCYDPSDYGQRNFILSEWVLSSFGNSWSMRHALPNGTRELNEAWGDYASSDFSYDWVMFPDKRKEIRDTMISWILNKVRYLQENGYPHVGVARVPTRPYVREGVRIVGLATYTAQQIKDNEFQHPVSHGVYALYDRHDTIYGSHQNSHTGQVHVPMETLMPAGHPWLLVSTAISTDSEGYCSAVRMESVRANMGGAAGIITAVAAAADLPVSGVTYETVRAELLRQGYKL